MSNLLLPIRHHARIRPGFTLMELIISISVASMLVLATTSVILVSAKTLELGDSLAAKSSNAIRKTGKMVADLKLALEFIEQSPTKLSFTVADRDSDNKVETISYEWKGDPDYAIFKTIDFSSSNLVPTEVAVLENVTLLNFDYLVRSWGNIETSESYSDTQLVYFNDDVADDAGNKVLLVIKDKDNLEPIEQERATWLTNNGFVVEKISDDEPVAGFNLALGRNSLVLVASTVNPGNLGDKLVATELGVVVENSDFAEQLELAKKSSNNESREVANLMDVYHPISANYLPGGKWLFESEQNTSSLSSNTIEQSPDLRTLAQWPEGPGLALLNQGDEAYAPIVSTATFGSTTAHSNVSSSTQYLFQHVASQFVLTSRARVTSISAYLLPKAATDTRFGIYSSNLNQPLALLGQTTVVELRADTKPKWVAANLEPELILEPGTYWIAASIENNLQFYTGPSNGFLCDGSNGIRSSADSDVAASDGMMANWPLVSLPENCEISIYANYETIPSVAGRRVQLPWGDNNFDYDSLTNVAQVLLKNALEWAGDPTPEDPSTPYAINQFQSHMQFIAPQQIPANALGWRIITTAVAVKRNPDNPGGAVVFQLFEADTNEQPTAVMLQQTDPIQLGGWDQDEFIWFEVPFLVSDKIDVDDGVCLIVSGTSPASDDGYLKMDSTTVPVATEVALEGEDVVVPTIRLDARLYVFGQFFENGSN